MPEKNMSLLENKIPFFTWREGKPPSPPPHTHTVPLPLSTICFLGTCPKSHVWRGTFVVCTSLTFDINRCERERWKRREAGEKRGGEKSLWLNSASVRYLGLCKMPVICLVLGNTLTKFCEVTLDLYIKLDFRELTVMHTPLRLGWTANKSGLKKTKNSYHTNVYVNAGCLLSWDCWV